MSSGNINSKSAKKYIRFPHELLEDIDASVEHEKREHPNANFSAWVIDACEVKLRGEQRKKYKDNPDQ
ncbi:hypothetical protein WM46_12045 [Citrobacter freundii complex sp. CFNIH2]|uniref:YlcI/YnfO family protein n=1 Tax=Citrobacter freundii complex sp. CFNIH2 TaxID=2066049 RepID=UPI000C86D2AB|nr:YlcI/YnfO family protein [Citrobacter freundii complex sp. CFNIH2]AUO65426.1 hypothetical protein WM46_12045 [Citrobacter freundii complex sp. CFNIH2]